MFASLFYDVVNQFPKNVAIKYFDNEITYLDLYRRAQTLSESQSFSTSNFIVLPGERNIEEFISIIACWISRKPYIPLNTKFSSSRIQQILERVESLPKEGLRDLAYVIFTSGTTGIPKGVPISRYQIDSYAHMLQKEYTPNASDKVMQIADFSFDLSLLELSLALINGATLCVVPSDKTLFAPRYAHEIDATIWVSVPSVISMSAKAGLLPPNSLPCIRLALFCGEALTYQAIRAFSLAAPNARLINTYGPTEATVSVTHFEIDRNLIASESPKDAFLEVMPLGQADPGVEIQLFDPQINKSIDDEGEICISSSRVTSGYLGGDDINSDKFFVYDSRHWYRTGDLAFLSEKYGYCYKGRIDRQIKFKGYRIELQDIESALRAAAKTDLVCVVPHPVSADGAIQGLVGVVGKVPELQFNADNIQTAIAKFLPSFMVPSKIMCIEQMPLSINGKIDYKAAQEWVQDQPG